MRAEGTRAGGSQLSRLVKCGAPQGQNPGGGCSSFPSKVTPALQHLAGIIKGNNTGTVIPLDK